MTDRRTSPDAIEADLEAQRAEIGRTVDALRQRLSPEALLDQGGEYLRGPGGRRLMRAVQENPLAAILTVAGAGWLLYTASQPERRQPPARARRRQTPAGDAPAPVPATRAPEASMAAAAVDTPAAVPEPTSATEAPASPATASARSPSTPETAAKDAPGASRPGVLGDQTQEQRLNQTGQPGTRITEDEVGEAFRKPTVP
jgi:hypothetical protein